MDGAQQRLCWSGRFASALFPVTQRTQLDIDHGCELGLGQPGRLADLFHLQRVNDELPRGLTFATVNL